MIGIAGIVAQELVDKKTIFDHFSQVFIVIIVVYSQFYFYKIILNLFLL